jgi:glycosyltransferase involved in cell wall biosynthesis
MRILILHSRYASGAASGENRVVDDEVDLLREAGHVVEVWQPQTFVRSRGDAAKAGVRAVWSHEAVREVRRRTAASSFDVVHLHNLFPQLSPAVIGAASETGAAVVMTLHNFRLMCLASTLLRDGAVCEDCIGRTPVRGVVHGCYRGSRLGSGAIALSLVLHRSAKSFDEVRIFSAVSTFVRNKLIEGGFDGDRISVRYNFARSRLTRSGAGNYFVIIGRLSPEKGLDRLVGSWEAKLPLVVVGDGPERQRLAAAARPGVEFVGAVTPEQVDEFLSDARALLFPSRCYEGSPRAVLEALATGVPVVAPRLGSLPEHIREGDSGLLVPPPGDTPQWIAAVDRLTDAQEAMRLGEGALQSWRARFSPAVALRSLEGLYQEALSASAN